MSVWHKLHVARPKFFLFPFFFPFFFFYQGYTVDFFSLSLLFGLFGALFSVII